MKKCIILLVAMSPFMFAQGQSRSGLDPSELTKSLNYRELFNQKDVMEDPRFCAALKSEGIAGYENCAQYSDDVGEGAGSFCQYWRGGHDVEIHQRQFT